MTQVPLPSDRGKDRYGLTRDLADIKRRLDALETGRGTVVDGLQASVPVHDSWGGSFVVALSVPRVIPQGFQQVLFSVFASAGQTVSSGAGNVGVQPIVRAFDLSGVEIASAYGEALSNGTPAPGAVSVNSAFGARLTGLIPGGTLAFEVWIANNGSVGAGTANVHLTATMTFLQ